MKKYFTTKEAFEAYINRTGQNGDSEPCIYKGYQTIDFRSEREIIQPEYMTERAYMLQMYDDYVDQHSSLHFHSLTIQKELVHNKQALFPKHIHFICRNECSHSESLQPYIV